MPKCVICEKEMRGVPERQKCCSEKCRKTWKSLRAKSLPQKSKARHRDPIPCQFCGEMFTPVNKQNTICRKPECRRAAKQALKAHDFVEKECPMCGKMFRTPNWKQKTCGYHCGRKIREVESKGGCDQDNMPTLIVKCVQCGRNFEREIGSTAKTCSFECAGNLSAAKVAAALWQADPMPDPFPIMQTLIPGVSWSDPIMGAWDGWDSGGVWVCVEERERRIAA